MKNLIAYSGGKDSEATLIWASKNLENYEVVFCDTGWESPKTYEHIKYIEKVFGLKVTVLKSAKYDGFFDMCIKKKRVASTKGRFCTEELKVKPMIDYILTFKDDVTVLQGVRNDESASRATLSQSDEYFKFYFEPYGYDKQGKPKKHSYRGKDVRKYCDKFTVDVFRPIIKWNAQEVFDYIFANNLKANPLYFEGFGRVGCFPCIMCKHSEIRLIAKNYPEIIDNIRKLEQALSRTFFPPNYIPKQFCDRQFQKKGTTTITYYASIDAVVRYVLGNPNQEQLFPQPKGCISVYNICEA